MNEERQVGKKVISWMEILVKNNPTRNIKWVIENGVLNDGGGEVQVELGVGL